MYTTDSYLSPLQKTCSLSAILINFVLAKLIITDSHSSLGTYKTLMIYMAIFEMTFGFMAFNHIPVQCSKGSALFSLIDWKHSWLPRWVSNLSNVTFYGFYGFCLAALAIQFIYRYAAVSGHYLLDTFKSWKLVAWLCFPFLIGLIWTLSVMIGLMHNEQLDKILIQEFLAPRHLKLDDYDYFASIYYITSDSLIGPRSQVVSVIVTSLITLTSMTIVFFGWKCYNSLKLLTQLASKSDNYRKLQNQLFYALVAQTLVPTVFLHFPALLLIISLIMDTSEEWCGDLLCLATAIYPAVNPIPTIVIVESYRNALIEPIRKCFGCKSTLIAHTQVDKICSLSAILINGLLAKLIITNSHPSLGPYKYLMIYVALFELIFGFTSFLHIPVICSKGSALFALVDWKHSVLPREMSFLLNITFYGFYGSCLVILAIQFIYRYAAVSGHYLLDTFKSWKLIAWFSLPFLQGSIWTVVSGVIFQYNEEFDKILRDLFLDPKGLKLEDYDYFSAIFYLERGKSLSVNFRSILGSLIILSLIVSSSLIILIFGLKCFKSLESLTSMSSVSKTYRKLQNQLFYALVAQTLIPIIFLHIPSSFIIISLFLNISEEWCGDLLCLATAIYPAVNPIPTIFIVDSYRKALMRALCCSQGSDTVIPMNSIEVTRSLA